MVRVAARKLGRARHAQRPVPSPDAPPYPGARVLRCVAGLARCYHEGLAQNVGVSNYGPTLLRRAHAALAERGVPLASNQIHFNLLYRRQGSLATVEACNELGVACLAYYPLAMGAKNSAQTLVEGAYGLKEGERACAPRPA